MEVVAEKSSVTVVEKMEKTEKTEKKKTKKSKTTKNSMVNLDDDIFSNLIWCWWEEFPDGFFWKYAETETSAHSRKSHSLGVKKIHIFFRMKSVTRKLVTFFVKNLLDQMKADRCRYDIKRRIPRISKL